MPTRASLATSNRRSLAALCVCVCLLLGATTSHAERAQGTVFVDSNGNGQRDSGEPGVPNVRVSDGLRISVTDKQGEYTLDITAPAIVFVVKPKGYRTALSPENLPRFYYCLLYTSPSPRDQRGSRMPSSA